MVFDLHDAFLVARLALLGGTTISLRFDLLLTSVLDASKV